MEGFYKNYIKNNLFFWIFSCLSALFLIAGFLCPPLAVIDGSVLIACGELDSLIALGCIIKAIDKGVDTRFQKGDVSLQITNDKKMDLKNL